MNPILNSEKETRRENERTIEQDEAAARRRLEDKIDRDLYDSFPASDPPGWTLGVDEGYME